MSGAGHAWTGFAPLALLAAARILAGAPGLGTDGQETKPFTHRDHVQPAWFVGLPEVWRDCRGCHSFEEGTSAPEDLCGRCHYAAFELRQEERPEVPPIPGFDHRDHVENLACRACHWTGDGDDPERSRKAPGEARMPVRAGSGLCARCHDPSEGTPLDSVRDLLQGKEETDLEDGWRARYAKRLDRDLGRREHRPFRHEDHPAGPEGRFDCGDCHAMEDAGPLDLGAHLTTGGCSECHVGEDREPLAVVLEERSRESRAAGTFAHGDHVGDRRGGGGTSPEARAAIEERGCLACHAMDGGDGRRTPTYGVGGAFAGNPAGFEGCTECHVDGEWSALVPSGHGDWDRCVDCHAMPAEDLARERALRTVRRLEPARFRVESQHHPGITGKAVHESCQACHRAPVDELPSRVGEREFRHATHLPAALDEESRADFLQRCARCHGRAVEDTGGPDEVGFRFDGLAGSPQDGGEEARIVFAKRACGECHRGDPPVPTESVLVERRVVAFPHDVHLSSTRRLPSELGPMDCLACHPSAGGEVAPSEEALACAPCHAHDEAPWGEHARADFTGRLGAREAASCALCHRPERRGEDGRARAAAVPAPGGSFPLRSVGLARVDGSQVHPPEESCGRCHERLEHEVLPFEGPRVDADREVDRRGKSRIHAEKTPLNCIDCHWADDGERQGWSGPRPDRTENENENGSSERATDGSRYPGRDEP